MRNRCRQARPGPRDAETVVRLLSIGLPSEATGKRAVAPLAAGQRSRIFGGRFRLGLGPTPVSAVTPGSCRSTSSGLGIPANRLECEPDGLHCGERANLRGTFTGKLSRRNQLVLPWPSTLTLPFTPLSRIQMGVSPHLSQRGSRQAVSLQTIFPPPRFSHKPRNLEAALALSPRARPAPIDMS